MSGESGYILDPYTLSTMSQATDGSTPAVVGQQVLRIVDQSPNAHALTNSAGPTLQTYGLRFDGTNDALAKNFTLGIPFTRVSAIRQLTWENGDQIMGGGSNNAGTLLQSGTTPTIGIFDGTAVVSLSTLALNTWGVITEVHNGASSSIQLNNTTAVTGNPGSTGPGGVTLGKRPSVETYANYDQGRCVAISRALTAEELAALKTWCGGPVGIVI